MRQLLSLLLGLVLFTSAHADSQPLFDIDPAVEAWLIEPANNKTWGWSFYVTTPITVTHLAWHDTNGDGLSHSHQIGLWKDTSGITKINWPGTPFPNGGLLVT